MFQMKKKQDCMDKLKEEFEQLFPQDKLIKTARKNNYDLDKTRTDLYKTFD